MSSTIQWYLSRYIKLSNGKFELISYAPMPSFEDAYRKAQTKLPYNEFYEVEYRVGSLLPTLKFCWVTRDRYSHKPYVAKAQADAEVKAQKLLTEISQDTLDLDLKSILSEMQLLKALLTKPQYDILLQALMSKPQVINILKEDD